MTWPPYCAECLGWEPMHTESCSLFVPEPETVEVVERWHINAHGVVDRHDMLLPDGTQLDLFGGVK